MQREQTAKAASLRVVPEDPDIEGAAARAPLVEAQASALDAPPAAATDSAESSSEAEELLEELLVTLLEAPNPFNEADKDDSLWSVIAAELSDELYDRLDGWVDKRMTSAE